MDPSSVHQAGGESGGVYAYTGSLIASAQPRKPSQGKVKASVAAGEPAATPARQPLGALSSGILNSANKFVSPSIKSAAAAKLNGMKSAPRGAIERRSPDDFGTIFTARGNDDSMAADSIFSVEEMFDCVPTASPGAPARRSRVAAEDGTQKALVFGSPARSSAASSAAASAVSQLSDRVRQLETLNTEYEHALSEQTEQLDRLGADTAAMESEHDNLCRDYQAAVSKLAVRDQSLAAATKRVSALTTELATTKTALAAATARADELEEALAARDGLVAQLRAAAAESEAAAVDLRAANIRLDSDVKALRGQLMSTTQLLQDNKHKVLSLMDASAAAAAAGAAASGKGSGFTGASPTKAPRPSLGPSKLRAPLGAASSAFAPKSQQQPQQQQQQQQLQQSAAGGGKSSRSSRPARLSNDSVHSATAPSHADEELVEANARLSGENEILQELADTLQAELADKACALGALRIDLDVRVAEAAALADRLRAAAAEGAAADARARAADERAEAARLTFEHAAVEHGAATQELHWEIQDLRQDVMARCDEKLALERAAFEAQEARIAAEEAAQDARAALDDAEERASEAHAGRERAEAEALVLRWVEATAKVQSRALLAARERVSALEAELAAAHSRYTSDLDAVRDEYNAAAYREKYCELAVENAVLRNELAKAELVATEAADMHREAESALTALEARLETLRAERARLREAFTRASDCQARFAGVSAELAQSQADAAALAVQVESLTALHSETLASLRSNAATEALSAHHAHAAALGALTAARDAAQADASETAAALAAARAESADLTTALAARTAESEARGAALAAAEEALGLQRERGAAAAAALEACEADLEAVQQSLTAAEARVAELDAQTTELACELETVSLRLRDSEARGAGLRDELAAAGDMHTQQVRARAALEERLADAEAAHADAAAAAAQRVGELERQLELLDTESQSALGGAHFVAAEMERFKRELERLRDEAVQSEGELADAHAAQRAAERQRDETEAQLRLARRQLKQGPLARAASGSGSGGDNEDVTGALFYPPPMSSASVSASAPATSGASAAGGDVVRRGQYDALAAELEAAKSQREQFRREVARLEAERGELAAHADQSAQRGGEMRARADAAAAELAAAQQQRDAALARERAQQLAVRDAEDRARTEAARARACEARVGEAAAALTEAEARAQELAARLRAREAAGSAASGQEAEELRASLRALRAAEAKHMLQVERLQAQVERQAAEISRAGAATAADSSASSAAAVGGAEVSAKLERLAVLEGQQAQLREYIVKYKSQAEDRITLVSNQAMKERSERKSLADKFLKMKRVLVGHKELLLAAGSEDLASLMQSLLLSA
jgi:chromosome segregation ATPase